MFTKRQTIFILIGRKESIDLNFFFPVEREPTTSERKRKERFGRGRRNFSKESEKNIHSKMESNGLAIDNA